VLLLNEQFVSSSSAAEQPVLRAYSFVAPSRPVTSPPGPVKDVDVPIVGVAKGTYLVRVQVDGAESPLRVDASTGFYASPSLKIA
jgi:hypothetical protein